MNSLRKKNRQHPQHLFASRFGRIVQNEPETQQILDKNVTVIIQRVFSVIFLGLNVGFNPCLGFGWELKTVNVIY